MGGVSIMALLAIAPAAYAQSQVIQAQTVQFNIPAQPLGAAMSDFTRQTGLAIMASSDIVAGKTSAAVKGAYTPDDGLAALLQGTGLVAQRGPAGGFVVTRTVGSVTSAGATADPEVVVVTAQRRQENLHDVPLTVNVVSGQKIDRENISTLRDVVEHSPQVSYQETGDIRTDTLSIRGISSVSNVAGVEPDAAIVIDGETLARTMEMNYDAVDIKQVEILEGPQGTLFGKNAVAGMLNVTTRGPQLDDHITATIRGGVAENDEYRIRGSVNIPLSPKSALYLNGFYEYQGGWVQNVHPGQPNGGNEKGSGLRAQYLYQPSSDLSFLFRAEYTHKDLGIIPYAFKELSEADVVAASQALAGNTSMVPQFNALLSNSGINLVSSNGTSTPIKNGTLSYLSNDRDWGHIDDYATSYKIQKDFDTASLIYLGSYRYFNLNSNDNEWGISAPQLTNSVYGLDTFDYAGPSTETTFQQELRLESRGHQRLNYVAGAFYYYNRNYHHEKYAECRDAVYGYYNGSGYPDPNPINPVNGFNCTGGYTGKYSINDFITSVDTQNEAFFANVDYRVVGGLDVFGGARALWEQQHMKMQHLPDDNTASHFYSSTDPYGLLQGKDHESALLHRIGVKYDFGPVMAYVTEGDGFKGVSWDDYNLVAASLIEKPLPPERPQQYEFGLRGDMWHHKLDWQFSAYRIRDKNFQARVLWYQPGALSNRVIDAGTSQEKGIEFGWNARPFKGFTMGSGFSWLKSVFLDSVEIPTRAGPYSLKGYELPNAPHYAYSAYADYRFKMPDSDLMSDIRVEMRRRAKQNSTVNPDPLELEDAYQILDLYYTVEPKDSRWNVTFYVKNALNKLYYERPYEPAVLGWTGGQMAALPRDYKRYFGINFAYNFN